MRSPTDILERMRVRHATPSPAAGRMLRRDLGDLAGIVIPCLAFLVLQGIYNNLLLLATMVIYIILAQGINVIYGFTGYLPFGYVGFFGIGAYGAALAVINLKIGGWTSIPLGALAAILLAVILLPLLRLRGAYFAIASLAASQGLYSVISNPSLTNITKGPYGVDLPQIYQPTNSFRALVAVLAVTLISVVYLRRSRLGMALRAVRSDQVSAEMAGVSVARERGIAWLLSAALGGMAGAGYAWTVSIFYPESVFDLSVSIFAIVFALFGGLGTLWGPTLGAVVLYGLYNYIGISQPQYFQLVYGLLIVVLVLFIPDGVASLVPALRRFAARRATGRTGTRS